MTSSSSAMPVTEGAVAADAACFTLPLSRGGAAERNVGDEAEAFEAAQQSHARYGSGALRAAVFGFSAASDALRAFSDGVVSTVSLLLGVHAERKGAAGAASAADAHEHLKAVALTGVAGLLAGAASMACGEWVSMQTQAEALSGQLAVERVHLLRFPAQESAEFAAYLRARGVRREIADAVVSDVAASAGGVDSALDIHARFEHGIDPEELGSASASAAASYAAFAVGAAVPLAPWLLAAFLPRLLPGGGRDESPALIASIVLAAIALAAAGGGIACSVTGGGAGALAAAQRASATARGRRSFRRGAVRMRILLGGDSANAALAWTVAWGALRQVAFAALAAGSTFAIGALIGANVS